MTRRHDRIAVIALMLASLPAAVLATDDDAETEREITLEQVPDGARKVILHEAGTHEILGVDEVVADGETRYEAEWIDDGIEVEIAVTPEGVILGWEREPTGPDDDED